MMTTIIPNALTIRPAVLNDLKSITAIYNEAVVSTHATIDADPKDEFQQQSWWNEHDSKHPILVGEIGGEVAGWGALSPWSRRCSCTTTAELSVYVKETFRGKGVGRKLLEALIQEGRRLGHHAMISRITMVNKASIGLHEAFGFIYTGTVREVGKKFGQWLDVATYQKLL